MKGIIDHQQLFDAALVQQSPRFFFRNPCPHRHQIFVRHQLGYRLVGIFRKADIAVGQHADQFAARLYNWNARYGIIRHNRSGLRQSRIGRNGNRIDHHSRFKTLYLTHSGRLLFNRQIAVQNTDAAQLRHDNRHARLGNRVHRRGQNGDIQRNRFGNKRPRISLAGKYI